MWIGAAALLVAVVRCKIPQAEITKVHVLVDMVNSFLIPPNWTTYSAGLSTISPNGVIVMADLANAGTIYTSAIDIPAAGQTHFQANLQFQTQPASGADYVDQNPAYGALYFVVTSQDPLFQSYFLLTNEKVYIGLVLHYGGRNQQFIIPIALRAPADSNLFTIVIDRLNNLLSFRIDNKEVLEVLGSCQIAKKFYVGLLSDYSKLGCHDRFRGADLPESVQIGIVAQSIVYVNPNDPLYQPLCLGTLFRDCSENLGTASTTSCVYDSNILPLVRDGTGLISSVQAFDMRPTGFCSAMCYNQESASLIPWWRQPCKEDDQLLSSE